jgi:hypothetical protein
MGDRSEQSISNQPLLADHIFQTTSAAISSIDPEVRRNIYAVSFWMQDRDDDPRSPTVTVGFNTEVQVRTALAEASSEIEARWNYAYWLQNCLAIVCDPETDPVGYGLLPYWITHDLGAWFEDDDFSDGATVKGESITASFASLLVRVTKRLHGEGVIEATFGRSLPVLIHGLEYDGSDAARNHEANPVGVVPGGFVAWCRGGG